MSDIGKQIKNRRMEMGLTQDEVAEACGVTKSAVCRWESGNIANMRRDRIAKLAEILNMNPVDIVMKDTHNEVDDIAQALHQNPKLRLLFDKSRKMSDADMDAMLSVAAAIMRERDGD